MLSHLRPKLPPYGSHQIRPLSRERHDVPLLGFHKVRACRNLQMEPFWHQVHGERHSMRLS